MIEIGTHLWICRRNDDKMKKKKRSRVDQEQEENKFTYTRNNSHDTKVA